MLAWQHETQLMLLKETVDMSSTIMIDLSKDGMLLKEWLTCQAPSWLTCQASSFAFPWRGERGAGGALSAISKDCTCDRESARAMIKLEQEKAKKANLAFEPESQWGF